MSILDRGHNLSFSGKALDLLGNYNPIEKGEYLKLDCPSCGRRSAYFYISSGYYGRIRCSHQNSCGYSELLHKQCNIQPNKIKNNLGKDYYEQHGVNLELLTESFPEIFLPCGSIKLRSKRGEDVKKTLRKTSGGVRFSNPPRDLFSAKDGQFYPPITRDNSLYIFEGEMDWIKGISDGLCSSSPIFGASTIPKEQAMDIFVAYDEINICFDSDTPGRKYCPKLAKRIAKNLPDKKINMIFLTFGKNEKGKDYCDWRKNHTVEEFLNLPKVVYDIKAIAIEEKKRKEQEKFENFQEKCKKPFHNTDIITKVEGDEKVFLVTHKGIFVEQKMELLGQVAFNYKMICVDPVILTTQLEDVYSEECYVKLLWRNKEKITPISSLWVRNMENLSRMGLKILSQNAKDMSEYFLACLNKSKKDVFATLYGWVDEDNFVCGNNFIKKNSEPQKIENENSIKIETAGDFQEWHNTIYPFLQNDPQMQIVAAAAAIAPLLKLINVSSFMLHVYGESSRGKTIGSQIAASFWGKHNTIMRGWQGSSVAHETYFHQMNNCPTFLEECQESELKIINKTVYQLGNNQGKTRARKDATAAKIKTWQTTCISTGEVKLSDASKQGGFAARTIEIQKKIYPIKNQMDFLKLLKCIDENYGHPALKIIQSIVDNKDMYKEAFYKTMIQIHEDLEKQNAITSNIESRVVKLWATILVGCEMNSMVLGLPYSREEIWKEVLNSFSTMDNSKPSENLFDFIIETYVSNSSKFHVVINPKSPNESEQPEVWGIFYKNKGQLFFFNEVLRREMIRKGFFYSSLMGLMEKGLLITSKGSGKKRIDKQIKYRGVSFRGIMIDVSNAMYDERFGLSD